MNDDTIFWIVIIFLVVLFGGEPDLHDALMSYLMNPHCGIPK